MSHIIALNGRSGSGKDTLAAILVNDYGYKRFAFGDRLRAMVVEKFGPPAVADERSPEGYSAEVTGLGCSMSMKEAMVHVGRDYLLRNPQGLAKATAQDIRQSLAADGKPIVVTDMRRPVEMRAILGLPANKYLVHIERPGATLMPFDDLLTVNTRTGVYSDYGVTPPVEPKFSGTIVNDGPPIQMVYQLSMIITLATPL